MKEFKVTFTETVTYTTIIEAFDINDANDKFMNGDFNDCDELDRSFDEVISIVEE